ncbi:MULTISPECIES: cbb3-type cytochrome c oxidase subunit 3 [Comamonadaceae]|jgi:cytochrome c oxidase cbb3-type subunit 4|uniref:CcoQ/FixQ family Cbb3-type cytochrome c oxidase assembly chaperone n=2 Tax=Comamonadaceae TaxID=80864 RepID=A0A1E7U697_9BURK|nr:MULTISPECIES: cbb3-type cytochrome c oxidase subunit 3 [Comamonadaceae]ATA56446.1 CcoQ/FixQ family Cbb3-type cytochrome c oxidase assembly chaperone [Variovorax boronicumulans]MDP9879437.1 cytochrome c oxidase cbb3-type subunit 4 [Variovorax boronicumulans]MDP9911107.1 cytochrome c oxidase cbb3-type subunit 4 [Variovorax boronicumulans]MDP9918466.1 cytochrome c oxidase cbb3-type subunit 4 [Variovorax boronicumulans]MDP9924886.1 cytochrome c oxidase cbb3-type subunit 4 [Variovorax boronicumu
MTDITTLRIAATIACFVVFIGIVAWACSRRNTQRFAEAARLPFEQD